MSAGATLLVFPSLLPLWFAIALPETAIFLQLNGVFLLAVGAGYLLPYRDPRRYRSYLWVFGVGLKTAGAVVFVIEYLRQAEPAAMLLFAAGDGVMAVLSLVAVMGHEPRTESRRHRGRSAFRSREPEVERNAGSDHQQAETRRPRLARDRVDHHHDAEQDEDCRRDRVAHGLERTGRIGLAVSQHEDRGHGRSSEERDRERDVVPQRVEAARQNQDRRPEGLRDDRIAGVL